MTTTKGLSCTCTVTFDNNEDCYYFVNSCFIATETTLKGSCGICCCTLSQCEYCKFTIGAWLCIPVLFCSGCSKCDICIPKCCSLDFEKDCLCFYSMCCKPCITCNKSKTPVTYINNNPPSYQEVIPSAPSKQDMIESKI